MTERRDVDEEVARRARRLRARGRRPRLFAHLAHVGVLGWIFILPVVGAAWLGHLAAQRSGERWPAVAGVVAGIAVGAYLTWRNVRDATSARREGEDEEDA